MSTSFTKLLGLAAAGMAWVAGPATAAIIGVNVMANAGQRAIAPSDLAGAGYRVANWNNIRAGNFTLLGPAVVYDDGTTVGGSFSVQLTAQNTFQAASTLTNDLQLYNGNVDITNGNTATVALSNIPFQAYDIYVYTRGATTAGGRGGSIQLAGDATTYYVKGGVNPDVNGNGYVQLTTTNYDPPNTAAGNYISYTGLSGASQSFTLAALNMGDATNHRLGFYGFQIVEVPEPAAAALAIGGLLFCLRPRRGQCS